MERRECEGYVEQFLIYNSVLSEVRKQLRNCVTILFDYKQAFDSVPDLCLLKCLHLVKVSTILIAFIERLTKTWTTIFTLTTANRIIVSSSIALIKGIFQRDSLFLFLFILALNQ